MFMDSLQLIRRWGVDFLEGFAGGGRPKKIKADELKALDMIDCEPALRKGNIYYDGMAAGMRITDCAAWEKAFEDSRWYSEQM